MEKSIEDNLHIAIWNKRKIKFRMNGTPPDKYFLYHPYAIISNKFNDEISIVGLIEEDYEDNGERDNQFHRPTLNSILEVILQDEKFEPIAGWKDKLKKQLINFIVSVD